MSKIINITTGVSMIGISTKDTLDIAALNDTNFKAFKTLKSGLWVSWTKGAPAAYQKFDKLEPGLGYVVTTLGATAITLPGKDLDINTVNISEGLNLLSFPKNNYTIPTLGTLPRIEVSSVRTISNGWKTWIKGAAAGFQTMSTINDKLGYLVNVTKVYNQFVDSTVSQNETAVKMVTLPSLVDNINKNNIMYVHGINGELGIKSIKNPNTVFVNPLLPKNSMFINVDGVIKEIEYPQEFEGLKFTVNKTDYTVIDMGLITETPDLVIDMGLIIETPTSITDGGNIMDKVFLIDKEYEFTFNGVTTTETSPALPDMIINDSVLEIMYDELEYVSSNEYTVMLINIDGVISRLSFAPEYTGEPFKVIKNGFVYTGVFNENITPVTLQKL